MLIFKSILKDEVFLEDLKKTVASCPEKETKNLIKNYQTRCLLSIFNKVFERLTYNSFHNYAKKNFLPTACLILCF